LLIGDAAKARKILGWQPKTTFAELVRIMVRADDEELARQRSGKHIRE
jgi:GDPmannose 4,6-dehydratase